MDLDQLQGGQKNRNQLVQIPTFLENAAQFQAFGLLKATSNIVHHVLNLVLIPSDGGVGLAEFSLFLCHDLGKGQKEIDGGLILDQLDIVINQFQLGFGPG